jgi:cyclopropane fatty-acyl-phospholipid synthase-like methyltransferase
VKSRSEACERNREPILRVLQQWLTEPGEVLEIGAGTGQHAVYFAERMPHLQWLATDREENHASIRAWIEDSGLGNLRGPVALDVTDESWPVVSVDYVFSANTAHIMGWPEVEAMFAGVGRVLRPGGRFCLYGPFNANGEFTSDSNRVFDAMLRARDPRMGIRDDRALIDLGRAHGLSLLADHAMPANNRTLVWAKQEADNG